MWAAWLVAASASMARRMATSLGLGLVSYGGFLVIKGQIDAAVQSNLASIHASIYQVVALAGFVDAIGIWLGALTTMLTLLAVKRIGVVT